MKLICPYHNNMEKMVKALSFGRFIDALNMILINPVDSFSTIHFSYSSAVLINGCIKYY